MRAAVFHEHGPRDVLQIAADLPMPTPGPGEVRLKMGAAALNRLDLFVREGWKGLDLALPHITCADGAGTVDLLGPGVTQFAPGDRVGINPTITDPDCLLMEGTEDACLGSPILGEHVPGVAAEYVVLPARNLIKLPDHISVAAAAAVGLVFVTAWHSLIVRGGLQPGESVLVVGASGGVNTASVQIAKAIGARVYVVGSDAAKCAQVEPLGADVVINREDDPNWSKAIYSATRKRGVDVVVDNVGAATLFDSIRAAAKGGRILIVGNTSGPKVELDLRYLFTKHLTIIGSSMGTTQDYRRVMGLVFDGVLNPVIGARLPLEEIREGHRLLEAGEVFGKIVLEIA
ncbi:MAG: zinc-binding dehydrogenase [Chloroflexi bacterium]|nr:zinc-binding dehydrogenase [Chloroflexota bacterium]